MKLKAIIFDLGNTVINFDHRIAVRKLLAHTDKNEEEIYNLFFDSKLTERFETGRVSPREFYQEVKKLLNLDLEYGGFVPIWNEIFFRNEEAERVIKELKGKYRLILLSNINLLHMDFINKQFAIIKDFDELVLSYLVGARKPDYRIYEAALEKANCEKSQLVYTDDREDLIKASSALGIPSIQFRNAKQLREEFKNLGILFNGA